MTRIGLVTTHHDPEGRLYEQMMRLLPMLQTFYDSVTVRITANTSPRIVDAFRESGVHVTVGEAADDGLERLGRSRRLLLADALAMDTPYFHLCDFDRALHWVEFYRDELKAVLDWLPTYDFVVLGRTEHAFLSHPRVQRDTERIINFVYAQVSGDAWDVTAASRGVARRAAELLVEHSVDETVGNDCTWPILLRKLGGVTLGYWPTNGLEFETADRYPDEVAAVGGVEAWKANIDADPLFWERRLELARMEVAAMEKMGK